MAKYKRTDEIDDDLTYSQEVAETQEPAEPEPKTDEEASFKNDMAIYVGTRKH